MLQQITNIIKANKTFKIAFIGDSLTSAEWVHPNWREIVEYVLKQELTKCIDDWKIPSWKIRCINAGLDGCTTQDMLALLQEYVLDYHPPLAIIMLGANDKYVNISPQKTVSNLRDIMLRLKDANMTIALATDPIYMSDRYNEDYQPYRKAILQLKSNVDYFIDITADFEDVEVTKLYTLISDGDEYTGVKLGEPDFLHSNALGNAYIAQSILREVFSISFDPEKYWIDVKRSIMYPKY